MSYMQLIRKRWKDSFFQDTLLVTSGTVLAQLITVVTMPLLSRIYSPEDFGIASAFSSVMSMLIPISSLRYFLAIALPKSDRYADALMALSVLIQIVYFTILVCVLGVLGNIILVFFNMGDLVTYKLLIPFAVLGASLYEMLVQCAIRNKLFNVIAVTKISQSFSGCVTKLILGWMNLRPLGLILGIVIGQAGGIFSITRQLVKIHKVHLCKWRDIRRVALKYRNFPLYAAPTSILDIGGTQLIPALVFSCYGATISGYFFLAQQMLAIPSAFIGRAIGQVFLQRASVARYEGNLYRTTVQTYKMLLKIVVIPMLALAAAAPILFDFVFGEKWIPAGIYMRYLTPFGIMSFAYSPISHIFNIQNRQKSALSIELIYLFVKVTFFYIGVIYDRPKLSILLYSGSCAVMEAMKAVYVIKISKEGCKLS